MPQLLMPDWPCPQNVISAVTTRLDGVSQPPFDSLNVGTHCGDNLEHVQVNRQRLKNDLRLVNEPFWLRQVHGNRVVEVTSDPLKQEPEADAAYSFKPELVCVVQTADCLPILLCNTQGTEVAAIHGGWRSLALNIISKTANSLNSKPSDIMAWLGPAIGPDQFEVGPEVKITFENILDKASTAFRPGHNDRWLCNIYLLARLQLEQLGIHQVYGKELCTVSNPNQFYSYRRDGAKTGRMASLIWIRDKNLISG